jgi:hypothetical protein
MSLMAMNVPWNGPMTPSPNRMIKPLATDSGGIQSRPPKNVSIFDMILKLLKMSATQVLL